METALHRQLKDRFGPECGGRSEVTLGGFRIDAVGPDGGLVEVQSGSLGPLRGKLARLLGEHRVRVVKPVVVSRRIVRRARRDGSDLSAREEPEAGGPPRVIDDLIGLARVFPHGNLDDRRDGRRDRRDPRPPPSLARVCDRRSPASRGRPDGLSLRIAADLWRLIPGPVPRPFTTIDLAVVLDRPMAFAQRVAYCLRMSGAAEVVGKRGNRVVYERSDASCD